MPVLNRRGQVLMGIAGGAASVDNHEIVFPGGGACWYDDDTILLHTIIGGKWVVLTIALSGAVDVLKPVRGANELCAGGGRYLAWLNDGTGLYGSIGSRPAAGLFAAGPDGTLAYCRNRQSGIGFVLNAPDGSELDVQDTVVYDMQILGPTEAIWHDGQTVRVVGRPPLRFALPPRRTRLARVDDEEWLVYWSEGTGLVAQVDGALDGYILESRPNAFNHDAVAFNGELVVAWSITSGEAPGHAVRITVDRAKPRTALRPTMPAIGRPFWFGCFAGRHDSGGGWSTDTDPATLPGNCYLLIPDGLLCRKDGTPIARYVEGRPDTDLAAIERAIAEAPNDLPILAYVPRQVTELPRGADWYGLECYRLKAESVEVFERRIRNTIRPVVRSVLLPQAFSSNDSLTTDLASIPPVIARIARDFPLNVIGAVAFNGSGRATGLQSHPDVRPLWEAFAAGIPSAPALVNPPPEDVPVNPKITVKRFGPALVKGQPWEVEALIGDTDVTVRIGSDGNLKIYATNAAGHDETGAPRHIEVRG